MAIVYDTLMGLDVPQASQTYGPKDVMLYALSLGIGSDPLNSDQLPFVYERALKVLPTFGVLLASPGPWLQDAKTGVDYLKVVHGEQRLVLHADLPASGTVIGKTRVVDIVDKGAGRGAIIISERTIIDGATGAVLAVATASTFARGNGGFGGPEKVTDPPHRMPSRKPDMICDWPTLPQSALLYRLNGDFNPLHADPEVASRAGFPRPILHGLATFGIAGFAVLSCVCGYDPSRLKSIACRFTSPVVPGETVATALWVDGSQVSFETRVKGRDVVAIGNGYAQII